MKELIKTIFGFIFVVLGITLVIYFIAINEWLAICPCIIAIYIGAKLITELE